MIFALYTWDKAAFGSDFDEYLIAIEEENSLALESLEEAMIGCHCLQYQPKNKALPEYLPAW